MPVFKLNRNYTLSSVYGHCLNFKKGEPTYVPPTVVLEVVAIGAELVEGEVDVLGPEAAAKPQIDPVAREEAIMKAFGVLAASNAREDFTGSGLPTPKAVAREAGFEVDKKELATLWQKRREALAEAE